MKERKSDLLGNVNFVAMANVRMSFCVNRMLNHTIVKRIVEFCSHSPEMTVLEGNIQLIRYFNKHKPLQSTLRISYLNTRTDEVLKTI